MLFHLGGLVLGVLMFQTYLDWGTLRSVDAPRAVWLLDARHARRLCDLFSRVFSHSAAQPGAGFCFNFARFTTAVMLVVNGYLQQIHVSLETAGHMSESSVSRRRGDCLVWPGDQRNDAGVIPTIMTTSIPFALALIGYGLFGRIMPRAIAAAPGRSCGRLRCRRRCRKQAARQAHPERRRFIADYRELLARDDIDAVNVVVPNRWHYESWPGCSDVGAAFAAGEADGADAWRSAMSWWRWPRSMIWCWRWGMNCGCRRCGEASRSSSRKDRSASRGRRWSSYRDFRIGLAPSVGVMTASSVGSWILEEPIHFFDLARWYMAGSGEPCDSLCPRELARCRAARPARSSSRRRLALPMVLCGHRANTVGLWPSSDGQSLGHRGRSGPSGAPSDARSPDRFFRCVMDWAKPFRNLHSRSQQGSCWNWRTRWRPSRTPFERVEPPPCTGADGRWSVLLCLAAEESVRQRREISLAEFASAHGNVTKLD